MKQRINYNIGSVNGQKPEPSRLGREGGWCDAERARHVLHERFNVRRLAAVPVVVDDVVPACAEVAAIKTRAMAIIQ